MKFIQARFLPILLFILIFSSYSLGENILDEEKYQNNYHCDMKIGDKIILNAVMAATGPVLRIENGDVEKSVIFYGINNTEDSLSEIRDWTDIFISGTIMYDKGFAIGTGSDTGSCANYATICPGSFTYDRNGVRIDYPGGGDQNYQVHCCGSYEWTPTYKPSYTV